MGLLMTYSLLILFKTFFFCLKFSSNDKFVANNQIISNAAFKQ